MFNVDRRIFRVLAGLVFVASAAFAPGCDWLKGSDMTQRSSPFLSGLGMSRSSVLCDTDFTISFDYDDPQGDIFQANIILQHEGDSTVIDESSLWPDGISRSSGTATFTLSFPCGSAGGRWNLTVTVEDDLGHTSNSLSGTITLNAAG